MKADIGVIKERVDRVDQRVESGFDAQGRLARIGSPAAAHRVRD